DYQRASALDGHPDRLASIVANQEQQQPGSVTVDERVSSIVIKDITASYSSNNADLILQFERGAIEENDLLTTDIHITPIAKLVERFNSNLQQGLTEDTVAQHRNQFGKNRLTPPPKPSLLWMFIKQSLIGFNGLLWFATIFAFLSYVSK